MGNASIFVKVLIAAFGLVASGFGILCYIVFSVSSQYTGETQSGIAQEFSNWGFSFMLHIAVQLAFFLCGLFIFAIATWSILQEFKSCG